MTILDDIINSIVGGNIEQLLLYFPIFIIGIGLLVLIIFYVKDRWHIILGWSLKFKEKAKKSKIKKVIKKVEETRKVDYKKEVENLLKDKDSTKAMDRFLVLINQYFAQLFNLHPVFTYEELINELEKKKKVDLKTFCEKIVRIEFSKNEVSRQELESIANEFLNLTKTPSLRLKLPSPKFIKNIKLFEKLKRFKEELQSDLEKEKTFEDKIEMVIEKVTKSSWGLIKGYFSSTKVPKKVSFDAVLEDVKQHKTSKGTLFDEDRQPTIEGFFYFIYLRVRKKIRENEKVNEINSIIKQGAYVLLEKRDVIEAQDLYYSLIPLYNSLSDKQKSRMLPKIVLFYEDINNAINFHKAMMYMLHLKLALKSKENTIAEQLYSEVSKIYEQLPSQYKNNLYEQFLDLEKELNPKEAE